LSSLSPDGKHIAMIVGLPGAVRLLRRTPEFDLDVRRAGGAPPAAAINLTDGSKPRHQLAVPLVAERNSVGSAHRKAAPIACGF
jgi:hypothetical protein